LVAPRVFISGTALAGGGLDVGRDFGCGLISLGRLYCWGANEVGQLGAATDSVCFEEGTVAPPTKPCSLAPLRAGAKLVFSSLSAGDGTACGIISVGAAYCWGRGTFGQLGNGVAGSSPAPSLVTSGLSFTAVSVGGNHACGIATGGSAYCWGQDFSGQLGDARRVNSTTPIPVILDDGQVATFASISAGFRHTCALKADGTAFCWGQNDNSQLGIGAAGGDADTPISVTGGLRFTSISAGGDTLPLIPGAPGFDSHTCGIAVGGAAYCWGSNAAGQLGTGSVGGSAVSPVPVSGGLTFTKISAGARHTCALTTAGAVYCWGRGQDLQLGRGPPTGSNSDSGTPQLVTAGELPAGVTFTTISSGVRHSCAVGSDGAAYCWGSNIYGALGNTLQAAFRGFPQRVATPR
jgi:alpha-tubulin suppressor-like RCC1 family protein